MYPGAKSPWMSGRPPGSVTVFKLVGFSGPRGQVVAVVADHHRDADLLGESEGLDDRVEDFLMVLGIDLDPASVPL
jgi:hypothetical protein